MTDLGLTRLYIYQIIPHTWVIKCAHQMKELCYGLV